MLIQQMNHTFSWVGNNETYNPVMVGRRIEKLFNDFTKLRRMLFEVFKRNGE